MFSGFGLKSPASGFRILTVASRLLHLLAKTVGCLFWVPDVLCWHSEVVLWNLLSVQIFF